MVALVDRGSARVLAGLVAAFWPGLTALALLYFIAAWAIVSGILEIVGAIRLRREIEGEWALGLSGVLSVLFGVLLAVIPAPAGLLSLVWLIGAYALAFECCCWFSPSGYVAHVRDADAPASRMTPAVPERSGTEGGLA